MLPHQPPCFSIDPTHILSYMGFKVVDPTVTLPIRNEEGGSSMILQGCRICVIIYFRFRPCSFIVNFSEFNAYQNGWRSHWLAMENAGSKYFPPSIALVSRIGAGNGLHKDPIDIPWILAPNIGVVVIFSSHSTTCSGGLVKPCMHSHSR